MFAPNEVKGDHGNTRSNLAYCPSGKSAPSVTLSYFAISSRHWFSLPLNRLYATAPRIKCSGGFGDSTTSIIACTAFNGSPRCLPDCPATQSRAGPTAPSYSGITRSITAADRPRKSVRNGPGSIIVTFTPNGAISPASASLNPSTANLLVL